MSYATELKASMLQREPKKNCCRKAYLNGFLFTSATCQGRAVAVAISGKEIQKAFASLIELVLHTSCTMQNCRGGGETVCMHFDSSSASKYIEDLEERCDLAALSCRCDECRRWFLRGMFLACGNPSDPKNSFRIDLTPHYRADMLASYLSDIGLAPLTGMRRTKKFLYYRSGEKIGDLYALLGETDAYFEIQNEFVKKEINNLTNRQNNCVVSNIGRSIERSGELIDLLERMKRQNKLSLLPDDLKHTAELRLAYQDYTLPQLAAISVPPLTKSGLNHRLKRILDIARKLDL